MQFRDVGEFALAAWIREGSGRNCHLKRALKEELGFSRRTGKAGSLTPVPIMDCALSTAGSTGVSKAGIPLEAGGVTHGEPMMCTPWTTQAASVPGQRPRSAGPRCKEAREGQKLDANNG